MHRNQLVGIVKSHIKDPFWINYKRNVTTDNSMIVDIKLPIVARFNLT